MYSKKECVAMLLAGGQGSRLYVLTTDVAKPAVPFGGKYRIIDFTLSNCINSDIDTVGVLTQYQPHELNAYIGNGQSWDLDRLDGGVHVLPPYVKDKGGEWYKGTANAIYQNISFIDHYNPEYVLVLSGDHIYKMDYSKMISQHKQTNADCTVAVIEVAWEEASRFGVMNVIDNKIDQFMEKPNNPKSNLASMGIYLFGWKKLRQYLIEDEKDPESQNDFGSNIIPNMIENNEKMMVYRFSGYWKDVGTIDSLWEANMDMLAKDTKLDVFNANWKISGRNPIAPPHYVGNNASIKHSLVTEGCRVFGSVENSVLFDNVIVKEGAKISYSIIMPGATIEQDAIVEYAIIAENNMIKKGAHIGRNPKNFDPEQWGIAVTAKDVIISEGAIVLPKQMVSHNI